MGKNAVIVQFCTEMVLFVVQCSVTADSESTAEMMVVMPVVLENTRRREETLTSA